MIHSQVRTLRDFQRIWFYWKNYAFAAGLTIVLLVMFFAYSATPKYVSKASVVLLPKTTEGAIITAGTEERIITSVTPEDVNTEIEIMKSDDLLRQTVQSILDETGGLGLNSDEPPPLLTRVKRGMIRTVATVLRILGLRRTIPPEEQVVRELRRSLSMKSMAATSIIDLRLKAENPNAAARVLNRYIDLYVKHHNRVFTLEQGMEFFGEQARTSQSLLDTTERRLVLHKQENLLVDMDLQNQKNLELVGDLRQELEELEISIDEAAHRSRLLGQALAQESEEIVVSKEMRKIPAIAEFEKALVPLLMKRSEIVSRYTPQSREYIDIHRQVAAAREEWEKEIKKALESEKMELSMLRTRRRSTRRKISEIEKQIIESNEKWADLDELQRAADLYRRNSQLFRSKEEDARVNTAKLERNLSNVSIADYPDVPVLPSSPNRLLLLFLSLLMASVVALILPFALEVFDSRLKTVGDVENALGMPVVCTIHNSSFRNGKGRTGLIRLVPAFLRSITGV